VAWNQRFVLEVVEADFLALGEAVAFVEDDMVGRSGTVSRPSRSSCGSLSAAMPKSTCPERINPIVLLCIPSWRCRMTLGLTRLYLMIRVASMFGREGHRTKQWQDVRVSGP